MTFRLSVLDTVHYPLPYSLLLESRAGTNMSNVLIHKANELKPATRAWLWRPSSGRLARRR